MSEIRKVKLSQGKVEAGVDGKKKVIGEDESGGVESSVRVLLIEITRPDEKKG